MTQLEHAGRRTTVLISAAVALVVSLAITISGMLIIPELTSPPASGGVDRYAESGRAWQVQRELESSYVRHAPAPKVLGPMDDHYFRHAPAPKVLGPTDDFGTRHRR